MAAAQRVVLLLAASDVTVLRVKVPPLSPARLKAALPNLVEEQLIDDPADCVMVAGGVGVGGVADGLRSVAVVQRAWLDTLAKMLVAAGAQRFGALPAQLCFAWQPGSASVAVSEQTAQTQAGQIELTFRLAEQEGFGVAIKYEVLGDVIQTVCALIPEAPISLYVPQSLLQAYQDAVEQAGATAGRVSVLADNWSRWIDGTHGTLPDLMAGMAAGFGSGINWRAWRWPLTLAAALMLFNAAVLNIDWWRMRSEHDALRTSLIQIYKSTYPKETVIIDPVAQMRQKIAAAQRNSGSASGESAPDDFTAITAALGEAWKEVMSASGKTAASVIAALEYRDRSLLVRLKPGVVAPTQAITAALAKQGLTLTPVSGQSGASAQPGASGQSGASGRFEASEPSGAVAWKIGSAK